MVILSTWSQPPSNWVLLDIMISLYDIIIFDHSSPLYQNHQLKKKHEKTSLPHVSPQSPPIFPNISTGRLWSCRFLQVCWICVEAIRSTSSLPPRRKVSSNGRCCHKRRKVKRSYGIMMDKFGIWLGKICLSICFTIWYFWFIPIKFQI